jgi:molybdopterin synthase catalytic subunit
LIFGFFYSYAAFADTPELMERLKHNYNYWKEEDRRLSESEAEQSSPL